MGSSRRFSRVSRCFLESFEPRRLLAAYLIDGTSQIDTITVRVTPSTIIWDVNGIGSSVPTFFYTGVDIAAFGRNDKIYIEEAALPITVNAGTGDDTIYLADAGRNLDAVANNFSVDGVSGNDRVVVNDADSNTGRSLNLTGTSLELPAVGLVNMTNIDTVSVLGSSGADVVRVTASSTTPRVEAFLGSANDQLIYDAAGATSNQSAATDAESVTLVDTANTFSDSYTIQSDRILRDALGAIEFQSNNELVRIDAGSGASLFNVQGFPGLAAIYSGGGQDTILVNSSTGNLLIDGQAGDDIVSLNPTNAAIAPEVILQPGGYSDLSIGAGAKVSLGGVGSSWARVTSLNIHPQGKLNVNQTGLIVNYDIALPTTPNTIYGQLATGFAGGSWNGNGIGSGSAGGAFAVGSGPITLFPSGPIGGFAVDLSTVVIRQTRDGDTDLDRDVDFTDLLSLAQNFGTNTNRHWFRADFDYDADTDFTDLLKIAQNFGVPYARSLGGRPAQSAAASLLSTSGRGKFSSERVTLE